MLTDGCDPRFRMSDLDRGIYDRVLPTRSRLLDALRAIDWKFFEAELREFYCPNLGQPAYPPLLMFKLDLLRYLFHLSDREVILRASTDLFFRYFLQIGITSPLPDPTSLVRFRGRLGVEGFTRLFDQLVAQARAAGLVRDRLRLKDASHILAAVAIPNTLGLLAQLRDKMLAAIRQVDATVAEGFQLDLLSVRQSTEGVDDQTKLQSRIDLITAMLQWIDEQRTCPDQDVSTRAWQDLISLRNLAEKILGEYADPDQGDRTRSVVDPDVRRGKHGEFFDGYLVDVMMDAESEIITAIDVLPANGDEAMNAIALIEHEQQTHGNQIEQLSLDGIGFHGEMLHQFEDPEQGLGIDVITPPRDFTNPEGFPSSRFELCEDGQRVRCPAGEISGKGTSRKDKPNTTFFLFPVITCMGCTQRSQCCPQLKPNSRVGRRVSKNRYEADYERARAKAKTADYQAVRRRHPAIERKLNELLRHHRGRQAKYWGLGKTKIQQLMTALVTNLKRIVRLQGATQPLLTTG